MADYWYIDLETTSLSPRDGRVRLIQYFHDGEAGYKDVFDEPAAMDWLLELCEDKHNYICGHNLKFDMSWVRAHAERRVRYTQLFDTMLAAQVLDAGYYIPYKDPKTGEMKRRMYEYSLASLVMRHFGVKLDKQWQKSNWAAPELEEDQISYALRDVRVLPELVKIQMTLLKKNNLVKPALIEFACLPAIIEIEQTGMPISWPKILELRKVKLAELDVANAELQKMVKKTQGSRQMTLFGDETTSGDLNLNSPAQIKKFINEKLGIKCESSDVFTLKAMDDPFAAKLLKYRTIQKELNFLDQFQSFGAESGRLYPSYNQARAYTGRMSSSRPNGQQIPKRGGKAFRQLFEATMGNVLVKVDFSAVELKIMAALSKDKAMIKAINDGIDLHKLTASKTSGKPIEEITKDDRQRAKAVNFGLIYGMSAPTLKEYAFFNYGVRMTDEEAEATRAAFFNLYIGIADWHKHEKEKMKKPVKVYMHDHDKGYHEKNLVCQYTLTGRRRMWPTYMGESTCKVTELFNSPDQGTGADIVKLSLIRLYDELPAYARIIGAVHDEIIVECPESEAEEIRDLMLKIMCEEGTKVCKVVPIGAEGEIGKTWGG